MAPRVLISDALSPAAVQIFKDRGIEVDFQPNLGKDKDKLAAIIGDYDGLAIRSATKATAKIIEKASKLKVIDPAITSLSPDAQADFAKKLVALVEKEGAGYDFAHYRDAPAGLRIWCGATVEAKDVALLTQWIDWAFAETKAALPKAA